ncbi:MAG: Flp pilus assembly complex ATPase component TadA [Rubrivivax sp.]|nr:Flp pilus assembly complex ATPase component TadA [Rubrivivax sp.]
MSDLSLPPLTLLPMNGTPDAPSGQTAGRDTLGWPVPGVGQWKLDPPSPDGIPCEVEGLNGRIMNVLLRRMDPHAGSIEVMSPGLRAPMPLRFAQFRRLTLPQPLVPTEPFAAERLQAYRMRPKSGTDRNGTTLGHVETPGGIFLFEPHDAAGNIRRVFVPSSAYESLSVGAALMQGTAAAPPVKPTASLGAMGPLTVPGDLPSSPRPLPTLPTTTPATAMPPAAGRNPAAAATAAGQRQQPSSDFGNLSIQMPGQGQGTTPGRGPATAAPVTPATPPVHATLHVKPAMHDGVSQAASDVLLSKPVTNADELLLAVERQSRMPMLRMGEALVALGFISNAQLQEALALQRADKSVPLGEILVRSGQIQRGDLQQALVRKMGYPVVDVVNYVPDTDALAKVPYTLATREQVLPLLLRKGRIVVAMEDPTRGKLIDEIEFAAGCKVTPALVLPGLIGHAIDAAYTKIGSETGSGGQGSAAGEGELADASELLASMEADGQDGAAHEDDRNLEQSDNNLVRLVNHLIIEAQNQGASDIHIECMPGKQKVRVRFRKDGVLRQYMELPSSYRSAMMARLKIMCDLDISEKRKPQDGKIAFGKFHPGSKLELRVATIPTANGLEDAVLRLLASAKPLPIDDIGLAPRTLGLIKEMVSRPYGMFLCVGPTGSGKTTTLHSALGYINQPDRKIWTAEDPVEITQPGLRQVQVNPKIDWTFARALRAFLRADPDVIMVGEIRDEETADCAVESSLTGHLVLSTLHTNSAPETVTRLLDMGMDPFNFADALLGVLAQRLVRRTCSNCRTSREATDTEIQELLGDYRNSFGQSEHKPTEDAVLDSWRERFGMDGRLRHYIGKGCEKCGGTGLKGRAGIHELMSVSRSVRRLIQTGARAEELQKQAMAEGMLTLRQDGIEKVWQGVTTLAEVRASSN